MSHSFLFRRTAIRLLMSQPLAGYPRQAEHDDTAPEGMASIVMARLAAMEAPFIAPSEVA